MSIIFSSPNYETITIAPPQWGCESRIVMALNKFVGCDGSRKYWDNSDIYDTRLCKCSFLLNYDDAYALTSFMEDPTSGKGRVLNFSLGGDSAQSGFYPFGPDLGDGQGFICRLVSCKPSGQKHSPWKWWGIDLEMVMVSAPEYSFVDNTVQGGFQFGDITGLRYPQTGFDVESIFAHTSLSMRGGSAQVVDRGVLGDQYASTFVLTGNQTKMAAVVNHIVGPLVRGLSFNIVADENYYAYGIQYNQDGAFICKLDSPEIVVRHLGVNQFELNLKLIYEGTDA